MCSDFEAGSYLRLIDFVYHSPLGSRAIRKKRRKFKCSSSNVAAPFELLPKTEKEKLFKTEKEKLALILGKDIRAELRPNKRRRY
jgi:hypothetical protein